MAQALIVIDIQEGLVKENPFDTKNFIINTKAIIQHFRDQNIEVIFIRHSEDEGLLAMGSDNWQVYHELKPQENEKIFNKYYNILIYILPFFNYFFCVTTYTFYLIYK